MTRETTGAFDRASTRERRSRIIRRTRSAVAGGARSRVPLLVAHVERCRGAPLDVEGSVLERGARVANPDGTFDAMRSPPALTTARLLLRGIAETDAPAVFRFRSDPAVMLPLPREPHTSLADTEASIRRALTLADAGSALVWVLVVPDGDVVGAVGLHAIDRERGAAHVAYELRPDQWGRGLVTEAMRAVLGFALGEIGLGRLEAHIDEKNARSRRLIERLGFVLDEWRGDDLVFRGEARRTAVYALTAKAGDENGAGGGECSSA
jgi:ribosomal-protein-alanine N-acetyltransferase